MYFIVKNQFRLCNDDRWREWAHLGSMSDCVRQFRRLWAARRKASRIGGLVVELPVGWSLDASGRVYDAEGVPANLRLVA